MVEVGRDLCRSTDATSLLRQGHLETVAWDHVQMFFEYLQGGRLSNLAGQHVPMLGHLYIIKVFPAVKRESPVFQFMQPGTTGKSLAPSSLNSSGVENTLTAITNVPSHLQAKQS